MTTVTIDRLIPIEIIESFIDQKQWHEAQRSLLATEERDIDDYLFLHNAVVILNELPVKMNEMIVKINEILDKIDPPKPDPPTN